MPHLGLEASDQPQLFSHNPLPYSRSCPSAPHGSRERHRAVPQDGPADAQPVRRARQALRRRHHPDRPRRGSESSPGCSARGALLPSGQGRASLTQRAGEPPSLLVQGRSSLWPRRLHPHMRLLTCRRARTVPARALFPRAHCSRARTVPARALFPRRPQLGRARDGRLPPPLAPACGVARRRAGPPAAARDQVVRRVGALKFCTGRGPSNLGITLDYFRS